MNNIVDMRGVHQGSLSVLSPMLEYWQLLNASWEGIDAPWWYNERASVGFLAGAVWKYGGWVMEEFSADKLSVERRKKEYSGRCDIAFGIDGHDFWGEAKQCWPALDGKNTIDMVKGNLALAAAQVRAGKMRGYQGLAITFVAPKVRASQANRRHIGDYIEKYIAKLKAVPSITLAWTFPAHSRFLRPDNDWYSHYFPGVILALLPVKPQKS
jgi:hypothetical protein